MIITELIAKLQRALEKHGDLPVYSAWEGQCIEDTHVIMWDGSGGNPQHPIPKCILLDSDCGMKDGPGVENFV